MAKVKVRPKVELHGCVQTPWAEIRTENRMNIYVGNLSYNTTEGDLRTAFASHGEVVSSAVIADKDTGRSKGFGFVEMADNQQAKAAIAALDGSEIDGRQIKVNEARPKTERSSSGSRGGGGGRDRW